MDSVPYSKYLTELHLEWETSTGALAIQTLAEFCVWHQGGGTYPLIDFLLSLYDGETWKPNMRLVCCRVDDEHFELVLKAMKFTRQTNIEPHALFTRGSELFKFLQRFSSRWIADQAESPA